MVQGLEFRVQGLEFRVQGLEFRVQGLEFRVQGSGFRVQGLEFRGSTFLQTSPPCLPLEHPLAAVGPHLRHLEGDGLSHNGRDHWSHFNRRSRDLHPHNLSRDYVFSSPGSVFLARL